MKYIFFSIFFILVIILMVVYFQISKVNLDIEHKQKEYKTEKKDKLTVLNLLATTEIKQQFPAKELYLKINLGYVATRRLLYQTIINNLDKYKLFGIEQILELNNIKYSIIKSKNDLKLFVNFDKKGDAKKIERLFKDYNFNVRLKKIEIIEKRKTK